MTATGWVPLRSPYTVAPDAPPGSPQCLDLTGDPAALDNADRVAMAAAAGAGAHAIWRTYLAGPSVARRVYLIHGPRIALSDQVLAFDDATGAGPAERAALAAGALLWTDEPAPPIRFAGLFAGFDPRTGTAAPDPATVDGPERQRLLAYLDNAPRLLATTVKAADVVSAGPGVPMDLRTDGEWVWSEGSRYYLDKHRLAPDPAFAAHIAGRGYVMPSVGPAALHRALAKVQSPV